MNLWLVNTYKNRYHQLIKLWRTDVESKAHISSDIETIYNDPNFKVGNPVRISKYKKTLQNITKQSCSEEVFVTEKVKKIL